MDISKSDIIESLAGRDKGKYFYVIDVEENGFSVVRAFVGHGVGENLHEEPEVPNFGSPGRGPRLVKGMTLAIEPMVNVGHYDVRVLKDKWTVVTADGSLSAHYENTVLITDGEPEILTVTEGL